MQHMQHVCMLGCNTCNMYVCCCDELGGSRDPCPCDNCAVFSCWDVRELWPFLAALFVSLAQLQTRSSLQAIISLTNVHDRHRSQTRPCSCKHRICSIYMAYCMYIAYIHCVCVQVRAMCGTPTALGARMDILR